MKQSHMFLITVLAIFLGVGTTLIQHNTPSYIPPAPKMNGSLNLELANTPELRAKGLAGHTPVKGNNGMLLAFEESQNICLWNRDVDFPISVGFFSETWELVSVAKMKAHDTRKTCSNLKAKYAVEMQAGFFKK